MNFFFLSFLHIHWLSNTVTTLFQELEKLLDVLKHSHELLSRDISIDSFSLMLNEMQENISLVSFSSRLASQVFLLNSEVVLQFWCLSFFLSHTHTLALCCFVIFNAHIKTTIWMVIDNFMTWSVSFNFIDQFICVC